MGFRTAAARCAALLRALPRRSHCCSCVWWRSAGSVGVQERVEIRAIPLAEQRRKERVGFVVAIAFPMLVVAVYAIVSDQRRPLALVALLFALVPLLEVRKIKPLLLLRGADKETVQWDSWRRDDGTWEKGGATPPHIDPPPCQPDGWSKEGPADCPDVSSMFFGGGAVGQPVGPDGSCFYTLSITLGDWAFHDARVKHQQEGCSDDLRGLGTTTLSFRAHPNPCG